MDWKVYYKPKGDDLAKVWVTANSREEAIRKVRSEYWDIEEIIDCTRMK